MLLLCVICHPNEEGHNQRGQSKIKFFMVKSLNGCKSCLCHRKPDYRYSTLSQEDEDEDEAEGADTLKYNPRPRGLRAYKDVDTDDDVSKICGHNESEYSFSSVF